MQSSPLSPSAFSDAALHGMMSSAPNAIRNGVPSVFVITWRSGYESGSYSESGTGSSELRYVMRALPHPNGPTSSSAPNRV